MTTRQPFAGFQAPNFTKIPNEVFDQMLKELTGAELRVLLYILRRTFGWHQHEERITQADIAAATGLSRRAVWAAAQSLQNRKCIVLESGQANGEGNLYRLNVVSPGPRQAPLFSDEGGTHSTSHPPEGGTQPISHPGTQSSSYPHTLSKERKPKESRDIDIAPSASPVGRLLDEFHAIPNIVHGQGDGGVIATLVKRHGEDHVRRVLDENAAAMSASPEIAIKILAKRCRLSANGNEKPHPPRTAEEARSRQRQMQDRLEADKARGETLT